METTLFNALAVLIAAWAISALFVGAIYNMGAQLTPRGRKVARLINPLIFCGLVLWALEFALLFAVA